VLTDRESLSTFQSAFLDSSPNTSTEIRLSDTFHPDLLKRASLALEEVIREIEEEAEEPGLDDDIVLLRSPSVDKAQKTVNDVPNSVCIGVTWLRSLILNEYSSVIPTGTGTAR
jgi:hypothetical protein